MKTIVLALVLVSSSAFAQKTVLSGSDTLGGVMTDAIVAAGLNNQVSYIGGGSGVGEKALSNGEIALTGLSRPIKAEAIAAATAKGINVAEHVIGLDGLVILVNKNNTATGVDMTTIVRIFKCEITQWQQVPGSGKTGPIKAFRRNDKSGTTDTFKAISGLKEFGACVTVLAETADIAERTSSDVDAVAYAGLSGKTDKNKALAVAAKTGEAFVLPTAGNIRNQKYIFSRKLFVYSASGAKNMTPAEGQLLASLLDRSFIDPILQSHDFVTLD